MINKNLIFQNRFLMLRVTRTSSHTENEYICTSTPVEPYICVLVAFNLLNIRSTLKEKRSSQLVQHASITELFHFDFIKYTLIQSKLAFGIIE